VAVTPGRDFGAHAPENFIRLSTASSLTDLHTAAKRLQHLLEAA
jgi:aspartate/methionine/tyrosine aminotransferase